MGLYAEIDIGPEQLTDDDAGISVLVDYTQAIAGFIDTFMSVATSLCPVRTGNLQGSINAGGIGNVVYAEATAEYAQYVEYGTSRMSAQPFFEPALEEAVAELESASSQALEDAAERLEELLAEQMKMETNTKKDDSAMNSFINALSNILVAIMLIPILATTAVLEDALNGNSGSTGSSAYDGAMSVGNVEIIIT